MPFKLNIIGRRRPGTMLSEHRHHIRRVHGEAVLRFIGTDPENAPRRYVQNAVYDGQYRASAPGSDPFALNRDFVTQIWVDDIAMLERSRRSAFYNEHLKNDEDRFVDQATVVFLLCRERELVARAPVPDGAIKLFTLIQRAPGVEQASFAAAWHAAAQVAGTLPLRYVQNDVITAPDTQMPVDAIDEFWLPNEAAASVFLASWTRILTDLLVQPGLASSAGIISLLAREDVVYPGACELASESAA